MSSLLKKKEITHELSNVKFDFYTPEEIKRISMKQITVTNIYNDIGTPNPGSLSDPCLGVGAFDKNSTCEVCHQNNENCTGHFGHIELSIPVYNPFLLNQILKLLNIKCFNCHKLKLNLKDTSYLLMKLFLIKFGLFKEAEDIKNIMYESFKEDTSIINKKIIKFIKDNLLINKNYFDSIIIDSEEKEEKNIKENKKEEEKENKKNKSKKNKQENITKTEEVIKKEILSKKLKELEEIFKKIENRHKEILKEKPYYIYEPSLTGNTLLKDFEKEFWSTTKLSKCQNCGALTAKFKKMNNLRFFRIMPSEKDKKNMAKMGIDLEKGALEHGASKREKEKEKKKRQKIKKEKEDPINEFKDEMVIEDNEEKEINEEEDEDDNENEENDESEISEEEEEKIKKGIEKEVNVKKQNYLLSIEVMSHIENLFLNDSGLVSLLFGNMKYNDDSNYKISIITSGINMFFIRELIIPPNRFRPENASFGGEENYYHYQTSAYRKILSLDNDIKELSKKVNESKERILKEDDGTIKNNNKDNPENEEKNKNNIQKTYFGDLVTKCVQLQLAINTLFDSSKALSKKEQESKGIRQIIEKKEGILRMKMMGKRVNHSGRTVISPDPLIDNGEIGIPLYIASKLYFPEKVTEYNIDYMKKIIKNGPYKYPGANQVISNDGRKISLMNPNMKTREKISNELKIGQTVLRHMQNGDILLVNRQPTLHKPSIMAHKAKILPKEKTFRLHYSNCACYNADFDGDEMNIHFLQDQISRGEGYNISNTSNQYIVPTDGKPIRGLLQDSIDSNVYLTKKDTFFTREEYYELLYLCLESQINSHIIRKIVTVPPAILKPKILYTGKQIISSILLSLKTAEELYNKKMENLSLNYEHNTKIPGNIWGKQGHDDKEGKVIVRNNILLTGVLDKNEIGNSDYGLFHSFYEIYGPNLTGELITVIGKLGVFFFQRFHAFTCSVSDILLDEKMNLQRRVDIENILMKGMTSLGNLFEMKNFNLKFDNYSKRCVINNHKEEENKIIESMKLTPEERKEIKSIVKLQNMKLDQTLFKHYSQKHLNKTEENDKYNNSYDQIELLRKKYESVILKESALDINVDTVVKNTLNEETSKAPKNWLEKGLIYPFPSNRFSMMVKSGSKGSVVNQTLVTCMLGQQELEGRRAPRLPNGKTLPSFEPFDPNPRSSGYITDRFSTGIRPQEFFFHAMAGREGLIDTAVKTSRSGYLQRCLIKHLEQLMVNYDYTVRDNDGNIVQFYYGEDSIDSINNRFLTNFKFIADNFDSYLIKYKPERINEMIDTKEVREARLNKEINADETMLNKFEPWKYLGSVSEKVYEQLHDYLIKDPDNKFKVSEKFKKKEDENIEIDNNKRISRSKFKNIIFLKYLSSLIQPGESVGVLAAEAIGEPSTQMTLNTFHLAGHGGANVTLGIPRLREILMTSEKNIKTPIMTIPVLSKKKEEAQKLARKFENYKLIDVLKEIKIKQGIVFHSPNNERNNEINKLRKYEVNMTMEHYKNIEEYFELKKDDLIIILKEQLIPILSKQIHRYMKAGMMKNEITAKKVTEEEEGGNHDSDEETTTQKYDTKNKRKGTDEDEQDSDNEEKEEESEQEKTYDDNYQKTDDEEEKNEMNNDIESIENEEEEKEEKEEDDNNTTNDSTGNDNNSINSTNSKEEKKKTKKKINNFRKEILERKTYIYNNITIDNMKFSSTKEENTSCFYFDLYIPYSQKNILLKNILNIVLKKINIKSVKNIKKCYLLDNKSNSDKEKGYLIQLEGFNFEEITKYSELIDINHISTNDIGGVLSIYGIEACRSAIVKEIVNVFDVYSIKVNKRHLGLIADYITFQGKYRSFSRVGISYSSSPLLKMTYETTLQFLMEACETKSIDIGKTPSSRIILGRPPKCGTGAFDIFQK